MVKAVPMKLPPEFEWKELVSEDGKIGGAALELCGMRIASVVPRRQGWMVVVSPMEEPELAHPDVAVRSVPDGKRWMAKWAHIHSARLNAYVRRTGQVSRRREADAASTADC